MLNAINSNIHQLILLPPIVFLDMSFLQQQLKVGVGLAFLYDLFVFLSSFSYFILFYVNKSFSHRNNN
jgi:hypothetical protein